MKTKTSAIFYALFISLFLSACGSGGSSSTPPDTGTPATASSSLEGTWNYHSLRSGNSNLWRYGVEQIDTNGDVTRISKSTSGNNQNVGDPFTLTIDANNVLSHSNSDSFHGIFSSSGLIVNTQTKGSNSNDYRLQFFQKQGASSSYTLSDLAGNWNYHTLDTGNSPDWRHGVEDIAADGVVSPVSRIISNANTIPGSNYSLNIDATGVISRVDVTSYHGFMSQDKTLMVATRSREGNSTFALIILQKQGSNFSQADLEGTWNFHKLVSGPKAEWRYGVDSIDANGFVTRVSRLRSGGSTETGSEHTLTIDSNGVITRDSQASYHAVMSLDKNLIIATNTSGGSGSNFHMKVYQRVE